MSSIMRKPDVVLGFIILIAPPVLVMGAMVGSGAPFGSLMGFLVSYMIPFSGALAGVWLRARSEERKRRRVSRLRIFLSGMVGVICVAFLGVALYMLASGPSARTSAMLPTVAFSLILYGLLSAYGTTLVIYGLKYKSSPEG